MSEESEKITIRLPKSYLTVLDFLVRVDDYPSRSEAIRTAVRDLIYDRADLVMGKVKKMQELKEKMLTVAAFEEEVLKR